MNKWLHIPRWSSIDSNVIMVLSARVPKKLCQKHCKLSEKLRINLPSKRIYLVSNFWRKMLLIYVSWKPRWSFRSINNMIQFNYLSNYFLYYLLYKSIHICWIFVLISFTGVTRQSVKWPCRQSKIKDWSASFRRRSKSSRFVNNFITRLIVKSFSKELTEYFRRYLSWNKNWHILAIDFSWHQWKLHQSRKLQNSYSSRPNLTPN